MNKVLEMMDSIQTNIQLCGELTHDALSTWPKRWEALKCYIANQADRKTCPECEQNADSGMNFCAFCGRELWRGPLKQEIELEDVSAANLPERFTIKDPIILMKKLKNIIKNIKDLPPDFSKTVDEHFDEIVANNDEIERDARCGKSLEGAIAKLKREGATTIKCISVTPKDEKEFKTIVDTLRKIGGK